MTWIATAILVLPAQAQGLSDASVRKIMDYAWAFTPDRFTQPSGETIEIDKKKRDAVIVPLDTAKEVIKVGRLSAHAQMCLLIEEQVLNHRSLMKREHNKKKWSPQQMVYINQLHLITVMLLTGKVGLEEKGEGKKAITRTKTSKKQRKTCTPEEAAKVKQRILDYVKGGPPVKFRGLPRRKAPKHPVGK